jgi:hypothetical protein
LQCRFDTLTTTICVNPTANDGIGATCALDTDCGGNAFCVHFSNNTYACRSTCRVGENDCSGTYPTCDQFTNDAYELNGVVYGYCGT